MLKLFINYKKGILFVKVKGRLVKDNIDLFNNEVIKIINNSGIRNIVYNLKELESIDLSGINSLINSYQLCKKNDGCILVCTNNDIKDKLKQNHLLNKLLEVSSESVATKIIDMRVR